MGKVSGPQTTISKEGGSLVGVTEQDAGTVGRWPDMAQGPETHSEKE